MTSTPGLSYLLSHWKITNVPTRNYTKLQTQDDDSFWDESEGNEHVWSIWFFLFLFSVVAGNRNIWGEKTIHCTSHTLPTPTLPFLSNTQHLVLSPLKVSSLRSTPIRSWKHPSASSPCPTYLSWVSKELFIRRRWRLHKSTQVESSCVCKILTVLEGQYHNLFYDWADTSLRLLLLKTPCV